MYRLFPQNPYSNVKALIVGAGGIGSELAKTLIFSGVRQLHVIDMDTIDVSNLNRQFLFRPIHVGMSKAKVLKEQLELPGVKITFDHGSVFQSQFNTEFIQQFSLVFNALDNIPARKHINRLCLAAQIPLFDAGTNGYKGNASAILGGRTRCYECTERPLPKQFPICSIRGFPNKIIHCVVWAKNLFEVLFGGEANPDYLPLDLQSRLEKDKKHGSVMRDIGDHLFVKQIEEKKEKYSGEEAKLSLLKTVTELPLKSKNGSKVRSSEKKEHPLLSTFVEKGAALLERISTKGSNISFDKDDKLSMAFVVAATNLRALTHSIPVSTSFEIKQMAGNIVPAISSTNALAAAFQVQEALKYLSGENPRVVYCDPESLKHISSIDAISEGPNPKCNICNNKTQRLTLRVRSLEEFTLGQFVKEVLRDQLCLSQPVIVAGEFYFEDTPEEKEQNSKIIQKTLIELNFQEGTSIMIDDLAQKVQVEITLKKMEENETSEEKKGEEEELPDFELVGNKKIKAIEETEENSGTFSKIRKQIKEEGGFIAIEESSQEESSQRSKASVKSSQEQKEMIFGRKIGLEKENSKPENYDPPVLEE